MTWEELKQKEALGKIQDIIFEEYERYNCKHMQPEEEEQ